VSQLNENDIVGDMACGSGYGTMMLSRKCKEVKGYDIDIVTIDEIKKRYEKESNINFDAKNLLNIEDIDFYDKIISFETIEHFTPEEINNLIKKFYDALKIGGKLIFSTPYNQEKSPASMRYHKTFYIVEETIKNILNGMFEIENFYYQDYDTHNLKDGNGIKNFIICIAKKI
jgi:2-polyprenyl-3-methyl-5-hydroxy-6-metoxy-1,4-benzoquinol methylase